MPELGQIWQDYDLGVLEEGIQTLFPDRTFSLTDVFSKILAGDILGALKELFFGGISDIFLMLSGMKNIFIWLILLGIMSALMTQFIEVFDKKQIADLSFYFMYLLLSVILLKCFGQAVDTAHAAVENIVLFNKLLFPTYLIAVGIATGGATVAASYHLLLLIILGVESIFLGVVLPLIQSYVMLSVINGIWIEEKLSMLMDLLKKSIGWILKAAISVVTGIGVFQAVITPVIDTVKSSTLRKVISVIPGVGSAAEGMMEMVMGSALVVKNSIGIILLVLLILLCVTPLLQIFLTAFLLKAAAAFMGIVSDKRITACANHAGEAGMLLFRTVGSAMFLFLVTIAVMATAAGK